MSRSLERFRRAEAQDPSAEWWKTLLKWLDSLKGDDYEDKYQWLQQFLSAIKPSEQTVKGFFYVLVGLLVLMSVWLVGSELYYAGFFHKFVGRRKPLPLLKTPSNTIATQPTVYTENLSARQQMALWLDQVIDRLAEQHVIPLDHSLTHRQIQKCLQQQASSTAKACAQLLSTAEPIVYGAQAVDTDSFANYRSTVQTLLGRLL
jgi:hypothetical protein